MAFVDMQPNPGKSLTAVYAGEEFVRWPIKTHVVVSTDKLADIIGQYVRPHLQVGDTIVMSEKMVAITQGRAFAIKDIAPSRLATFLSKYVHRTPYGIGLGSPWTMELALREAGAPRILFAAAIAAIAKVFGVKGLFYKLAGNDVNAIDGPTSHTLPPYNQYAVLGPLNADGVAEDIKKLTGHDTVIIDANDLGLNILGTNTAFTKRELIQTIFKDNPLGQSSEQTPLCLVRRSGTLA